MYNRINKMSLPVPIETMTKWVQSWVHYDGLASAHNRQSTNARKIRDEYESHIINSLKGTPQENMIIQIHSGRLQIMDEKHLQPLTMGRLEDILHDYYKKNHPTGLDEANNILRYVRENKGYTLTKRIKKTTHKELPPLPSPPPLPTKAIQNS